MPHAEMPTCVSYFGGVIAVSVLADCSWFHLQTRLTAIQSS